MDRLRNFGIVAHIDAGKTTLSERILFDAGAQRHLGEVDDGTAAMDWMRGEQERGISITAAATRLQWHSLQMQLVDTPGHVDFTAEVERCLRVLDGVVVLLDSVRGVESQTETVWQQAAHWALPALVFVNKMDRAGADYAGCMQSLRDRLRCVPLPLVIPLFREGVLAGLGDVIAGEVQWFDGPIPAAELPQLRAQLLAAREQLLEACADFDDGVLEAFLHGRMPDPAQLTAVVRAACRELRAVPVLCGSALHNRGVEWLLDAVASYLPAPAQRPRLGPAAHDPAADADAPFCGLVFKLQHMPDAVLHYVRVFSGTLSPGDWVRCARTGEDVAVGEIWAMHAMRHEALPRAGPGEIVVIAGPFAWITGDTLHHPQHPVVLPPPQFPRPVITCTFEPAAGIDLEPLWHGLRELAKDDPTLAVDTDAETGLPAVSGMGELHLEVAVEQLRERFGIACKPVRPRVALVDTIEQPAAAEAEVRAMVDGRELRATAGLRAEVLDPAAPVEVQIAKAAAGELAEAVKAALLEQLAVGLPGGHPARGMRVTIDALGATQPHAQCVPLCLQAAAIALERLLQKAGVRRLEPRVSILITCSPDAVTAVLADLGGRGIEVRQVSSGAIGGEILARGCLRPLIGYATRLRSISKGRGRVQLVPDGYETMPAT